MFLGESPIGVLGALQLPVIFQFSVKLTIFSSLLDAYLFDGLVLSFQILVKMHVNMKLTSIVNWSLVHYIVSWNKKPYSNLSKYRSTWMQNNMWNISLNFFFILKDN